MANKIVLADLATGLTSFEPDAQPIGELESTSGYGSYVPKAEVRDIVNVLPTQQGYISFFGENFDLGGLPGQDTVQQVIAYRTLHGINVLLAFCNTGAFIRALGSTEATALEVVDLATLHDWKPVTLVVDYSTVKPGTVYIVSANHGLPAGLTAGVVISGTIGYDGEYAVTKINDDSFYFTHAFTGTSTGQWSRGIKVKHLANRWRVPLVNGGFNWLALSAGPVPSANPWCRWTYAIVRNQLYFYQQGLGAIASLTDESPDALLVDYYQPNYIIGTVKGYTWTIEGGVSAGDGSACDSTSTSVAIPQLYIDKTLAGLNKCHIAAHAPTTWKAYFESLGGCSVRVV